MQDAGELTHMARSGRVIVRLARALPEGQILCDERSRKVAKVMEIIGPVSRPYASAVPLTNSIEKHIGRRLFVQPPPAGAQKGRGRRR